MVSLLIAVVVMAIVFDYINGFHDAANAIATVVSTGVLPIRTAVLIAGVLNFVGAMTGTAVAKTIASGFADPAIVTQSVVLAALLGASAWNLITWWYGIPSSSSHALVGGLAGAVVGLGVVDRVIDEPLGAAHNDREAAIGLVKDALLEELERLAPLTPEELLASRYERFRSLGRFHAA